MEEPWNLGTIFLQTLGIPLVVWHFSYKELIDIAQVLKNKDASFFN